MQEIVTTEIKKVVNNFGMIVCGIESRIKTEMDKDKISISFEDLGVPFNPLDKADPDITLSAEDRKIGGLGIFMVKKTMDNVSYQNINGKNVLKIEKKIN